MDYQQKLFILEDKHVRYQMNALMHFWVHIEMFWLAFKYGEWKEVAGQVPRILLAIPGSLTGMAPEGNVGTTKMGIFEKKP